jgi:hypothetical protein
MTHIRCKHTGIRGQCLGNPVEGSDFCGKHSKEEHRLRGYYLKDPELRKRFEHHAAASSIDTLREEVVLLRTLIHNRVDLCSNDAEQIVAFQAVVSALGTVEKLVNSLSKLERLDSLVLDKAALNDLGDKIVEILTENLKDIPDRDRIVDRVAEAIANAIVEARNKE